MRMLVWIVQRVGTRPRVSITSCESRYANHAVRTVQQDDGALRRGADVLQHALEVEAHRLRVEVAVLLHLHARVRKNVVVVACGRV